MKRVLFFGFYDRTYSRTKVLKKGFEQNGWHVEECHVDTRSDTGVGKYIKLFRLGLRARSTTYDLVIVGFPGNSAVPIARLLFGRRIVFDAFLSQFEANVMDRKLYGAKSLKGIKDRLLDTWACKLAGTVLLDTNSNIEYFVKEFGLSRNKFIRVFVGADDALFFPVDVKEADIFTVHFHGNFIPVQGIMHIVEAADHLRDENIRFRIIGQGKESARIDSEIERLGLKGVIERLPKVPVEDLPGYMAQAHVCLGLFGPIERALRAIPNKVYEAMAMGKAIITEDGSGVRELPDADKLFVLIPPADGKALAEAILRLRNDDRERELLGKNARRFFEQRLLPERLVGELLRALGFEASK